MELYPFRYRDPLTGKWVKARYPAERREIAARYHEWEIVGPPEIRELGNWGAGFAPYRDPLKPKALGNIEMSPCVDDSTERALARIFLRRYVTWCARTGRHAGAGGAARLWLELAGRVQQTIWHEAGESSSVNAA